jgi:hypothetical protein
VSLLRGFRHEMRAIARTVRFQRYPVEAPSPRTDRLVALILGVLVLAGAVVTYAAVTRGLGTASRAPATVPATGSAVRPGIGPVVVPITRPRHDGAVGTSRH